MGIHNIKPVSLLISDRIAAFNQQVLRGRIVKDSVPLETAAYLVRGEPVPYGTVVKKSFKPVQLPFRWGPRWGTAWFKVSGSTPKSWAGGKVMLHVDTGTEALVWLDGRPWHGLSVFHKRVPLYDKCGGKEKFSGYIEAAANRLFGKIAGVPADLEKKKLPALVTVMELVLIDEEIYGLSLDIDYVVSLHKAIFENVPKREGDWGKMPEPRFVEKRGREVTRALEEAMDVLDEDDLAATAPKARRILSDCIRKPNPPDAMQCSAVGHAHIDTAWLWPLRESRRKCARTFSTVLRNMEIYPEYKFIQSQAQLYEFVAEDYPELIDEIKKRVSEGRWEAGGGMWVEADCNISSGESLVRQFLHGDRFWKTMFGKNIEQTYLWLPDVFGYSAALPQILKHCGINTFFTQKMSWSQFNIFPHTTFWWQGIDGSRVLSHFFPTDTYNGSALPEELIRGERNCQQSDLAGRFIEVFGYGDGGGGPTANMIEYLRRAKDSLGVPKVEMQLPSEFCERLHGEVEGKRVPVWAGELFLEFHRGTYTTIAEVKRNNRKAELGLREAEIWASLAWGAKQKYPRKKFEAAWKTLLCNQFHDILPGSSIRWVYDDSRKQFNEVFKIIDVVKSEAISELIRRSTTSRDTGSLAVFNPSESEFSGVLEVPAGDSEIGQESVGQGGEPLRLVFTRDVPALGLKIDSPDTDMPCKDERWVKATPRKLENQFLKVRLDSAGRVVSLLHKPTRREAVPAGRPMNQLVLYKDRPMRFQAWDVEIFYMNTGAPVSDKAEIRVLDSGPLRGTIEVKRKLGRNSSIIQRIVLDAFSPRVDFVTEVDWHEKKKFLRVLHPVDLVTDYATLEIQYGQVRRPTHFNTSWDYARFEQPAHTWADISEPDFGVAMLNDCKYGHSTVGNVLGLSLLRSTDVPCEDADMGLHHFTYSLMPHADGPEESGVIQQARLLNSPPSARIIRKRETGGGSAVAAPLFEVPEGVRVECVKMAEDSPHLVVRLVEARGCRLNTELHWNAPVKSVEAADCLERTSDLFPVRHDVESGITSFSFTPFAIRTLKVKP